MLPFKLLESDLVHIVESRDILSMPFGAKWEINRIQSIPSK